MNMKNTFTRLAVLGGLSLGGASLASAQERSVNLQDYSFMCATGSVLENDEGGPSIREVTVNPTDSILAEKIKIAKRYCDDIKNARRVDLSTMVTVITDNEDGSKITSPIKKHSSVIIPPQAKVRDLVNLVFLNDKGNIDARTEWFEIPEATPSSYTEQVLAALKSGTIEHNGKTRKLYPNEGEIFSHNGKVIKAEGEREINVAEIESMLKKYSSDRNPNQIIFTIREGERRAFTPTEVYEVNIDGKNGIDTLRTHPNGRVSVSFRGLEGELLSSGKYPIDYIRALINESLGNHDVFDGKLHASSYDDSLPKEMRIDVPHPIILSYGASPELVRFMVETNTQAPETSVSIPYGLGMTMVRAAKHDAWAQAYINAHTEEVNGSPTIVENIPARDQIRNLWNRPKGTLEILKGLALFPDITGSYGILTRKAAEEGTKLEGGLYGDVMSELSRLPQGNYDRVKEYTANTVPKLVDSFLRRMQAATTTVGGNGSWK
jgi:hypothetical protein